MTLFLALALAAAPPSDWPQFRGPGGRGASPDTGVPLTWTATENVVWKAELPGAGTSSPVVVGRRVFLTNYTGYNVPGQPKGEQDALRLHALCFDRGTGKPLWDHAVPARLPEQATIRDGHGYASATPAADADRVYVSFGKSGLYALDHDGNRLWKADLGDGLNGWGSAPSPIVVGDLVVVNASVECECLIAFDKKTGKEAWRAKNVRESWNTPVVVPVGDKSELVVAVFGKVLGLDPATGRQLWSCDTGIASYMVPGVVAADGVVYVIGGRTSGALAVRAGGTGDVTATHRLWTLNKGSTVSSPVLHDGHLYWMHNAQEVAFCVEAKTGKVVYEQRVNRADQVYASAVLAEGRVYYVSRPGRVVVLAAKPAFEVLATNAALDRSTHNASPAVAGGRLFLRSDKFLYCLGSK